MEIDYTPKLTYSDVLLKPRFSAIMSREDEINTSTDFLDFPIYPIISANMDYVTGVDMALAMQNLGAIGILNRFEDFDTQLDNIIRSQLSKAIISVGIRDLDDSLSKIEKSSDWIIGVCIDVAHGEHLRVIMLIERIKNKFPQLKIIAGNVATGEGFWNLATAGADAIKVGIGPGSVCTTREVTGVGVPQLSAIIECAIEARITNTHLIADGGINSSGDIVKALAAGADSVMIGRLFAGHDECPIQLQNQRVDGYRPYRGQSMLGVNKTHYAPEGVLGWVPAKGPVEDTFKKLIGGITSGFSYLGARNIKELREFAKFIVVSSGTRDESSTRVRID